jgi:Domain of unknown function (DUF4259)
VGAWGYSAFENDDALDWLADLEDSDSMSVRNLCQPRGRVSHNPLVWRRHYHQGRVAGALADWLHNLAEYAATDFRSFDTDWFWQEYAGVCRDYPDLIGPDKWIDFRGRYERHLEKQNAA